MLSAVHFSDFGSDKFFGECRFNNATKSRPEAGTPTLCSRTISRAVIFRP